jgi:hypothetical protein
MIAWCSLTAGRLTELRALEAGFGKNPKPGGLQMFTAMLTVRVAVRLKLNGNCRAGAEAAQHFWTYPLQMSVEQGQVKSF